MFLAALTSSVAALRKQSSLEKAKLSYILEGLKKTNSKIDEKQSEIEEDVKKLIEFQTELTVAKSENEVLIGVLEGITEIKVD